MAGELPTDYWSSWDEAFDLYLSSGEMETVEELPVEAPAEDQVSVGESADAFSLADPSSVPVNPPASCDAQSLVGSLWAWDTAAIQSNLSACAVEGASYLYETYPEQTEAVTEFISEYLPTVVDSAEAAAEYIKPYLPDVLNPDANPWLRAGIDSTKESARTFYVEYFKDTIDAMAAEIPGGEALVRSFEQYSGIEVIEPEIQQIIQTWAEAASKAQAPVSLSPSETLPLRARVSQNSFVVEEFSDSSMAEDQLAQVVIQDEPQELPTEEISTSEPAPVLADITSVLSQEIESGVVQVSDDSVNQANTATPLIAQVTAANTKTLKPDSTDDLARDDSEGAAYVTDREAGISGTIGGGLPLDASGVALPNHSSPTLNLQPTNTVATENSQVSVGGILSQDERARAASASFVGAQEQKLVDGSAQSLASERASEGTQNQTAVVLDTSNRTAEELRAEKEALSGVVADSRSTPVPFTMPVASRANSSSTDGDLQTVADGLNEPLDNVGRSSDAGTDSGSDKRGSDSTTEGIFAGAYADNDDAGIEIPDDVTFETFVQPSVDVVV